MLSSIEAPSIELIKIERKRHSMKESKILQMKNRAHERKMI